MSVDTGLRRLHLKNLGSVSDPPTPTEALGIVHAWRTMTFDEAADLFHRETGFMAPGKDVAAGAYGTGSPEDRRHAWDQWTDVKNQSINSVIEDAIARNAERRAGVKP